MKGLYEEILVIRGPEKLGFVGVQERCGISAAADSGHIYGLKYVKARRRAKTTTDSACGWFLVVVAVVVLGLG